MRKAYFAENDFPNGIKISYNLVMPFITQALRFAFFILNDKNSVEKNILNAHDCLLLKNMHLY